MESTFGYFPLFINLAGKEILIIGGGRVATRRASKLQPFGPNITVQSIEFSEELLLLEASGKIKLRRSPYHRDRCNLDAVFLVIAATDDRSVNQEIGEMCKSKTILCVVSDAREETEVYFPALVEEDDFLMGLVSKTGDHSGLRKRAETLRGKKHETNCKNRITSQSSGDTAGTAGDGKD